MTKRSDFGLGETLRSMAMVAGLFALFVAGVEASRDGLVRTASADAGTVIVEGTKKKGGAIGLVIMVSLQRAG
jgi:Na+/phosphate symporter